MLTIGNDELQKASFLGDFVLCERCGERHKIYYGKDANGNKTKLLSFVKCGERTFLVGLNGKDIRRRT
jgi:hypothetical protein